MAAVRTEPMDTGKSTVSAGLLILQPLVINAIGIPVTALIIRSLGPFEYGEWATGSALAGFAAIFTNLGLRPMFIRAVAQCPDQARAQLAEQIGLRAWLAILACCGSLLLCLALRYSPTILACVGVTCVGVLIATIGGALADLLQGFERQRVIAGSNFVSGVAVTAVQLAAVLLHCGPIGLAFAYLVSPSVALALLMLYVWRQFFPIGVRFSIARSRVLLAQSGLLSISQVVSTARTRLEALLVPKLVGVAPFGYYATGTVFSDRLVVVPDGFATVYYPAVARAHSEGEDKPNEIVHRFMLISIITCVPVAVLVAFLARPIAAFVFPHQGEVCRQVMQTTIWAIPLLGILMPMSYSIQAVGQQDRVARAGLWSSLATTILCCVLIPIFGVAGASWSYFLRSVVLGAFLLPSFVRTFPGVLPRTPLLRVGAGAAAMSLVLWISVRVFPGPALLAVSVVALLSTGVYAAMLVALRVVNPAVLIGSLRRVPASRSG